jgi:hypothetical protein
MYSPQAHVLKYASAAALLGAGWFVVLLLPTTTRGWLLEEAPRNLALLVVASVVVALAFRRFIAGADTFGSQLARAVILPYVGCLVYLGLVAAWIWVEDLLFGGLANLHDTLSLFVMGLTAAALSFLVVVPYGLLCQYVMSAAANRT